MPGEYNENSTNSILTPTSYTLSGGNVIYSMPEEPRKFLVALINKPAKDVVFFEFSLGEIFGISTGEDHEKIEMMRIGDIIKTENDYIVAVIKRVK